MSHEERRGTRGSSTPVSSGHDGFASWNLSDARLELINGNVDITRQRAQFLNLLRAANIEEEQILFIGDERPEFLRIQLPHLLLPGSMNAGGEKETERKCTTDQERGRAFHSGEIRGYRL